MINNFLYKIIELDTPWILKPFQHLQTVLAVGWGRISEAEPSCLGVDAFVLWFEVLVVFTTQDHHVFMGTRAPAPVIQVGNVYSVLRGLDWIVRWECFFIH